MFLLSEIFLHLLDDVPSVLAHFVYNMRLRVELLTINFSQHITPELCPHIQQALISVETCATRLRLFDSTDNSTAWKNLKQRITWFLSNLLCNDQERLGLQSQLEELCNRFGNVLSESLSHRLRTLLGFGQNMKAVLCITDGMNMVDLQAAEIYMRTTSDIPHDAFSPEFMDVTEQVRACMRQVIAEPYKDSPEEVVELVHRLSAWQVEHFLSHFRCEAFNVSDVFGLLRFRGMQSVAVDSADSFPSTGYQLAGHIDVRDESESSGGEEKMDISEKEFAAENTVVSNGGRDSYQNEESPINQLDGMQPCRLEPGTEHPMDNITAALVDSVGSSKEKEYETHSSGNALRVEREQNDRVAIVRPRIPCEGLVAGLSMEEWESQVASADSNKESIYKVREQLVAAIRGQKETVVSLQNEITTMKKSSTVVHTMDDTCGDKQRKLIVADMWIQKMEDWNAALDEAVCKVQPKTISNVINCEVLKNLLRRVIEGHSSGGICSVLTLVSSVTQLINEVDVYAVLSDMYS